MIYTSTHLIIYFDKNKRISGAFLLLYTIYPNVARARPSARMTLAYLACNFYHSSNPFGRENFQIPRNRVCDCIIRNANASITNNTVFASRYCCVIHLIPLCFVVELEIDMSEV